MTEKETDDKILSLLSRFTEQSTIWEGSSLGPATVVFDLANGYYCVGNASAEILLGKLRGVALKISNGLELVYPADRTVIFQQILPHARAFIENLSGVERRQLVFSFNVRVSDSNGSYLTLLLKSVIVDPTSDLTILTNAFDISGHHKDNVITYTIESNYTDSFAHQHAKLLFKASFYPKEKIIGLTDRESEVLHYICEGYSSKQIAGKLDVSIYTINNHRKSILRKTEQKTVSGMVKYALENGYAKQI